MNAGRLRVPSPLSRVKSYTIAAFGTRGHLASHTDITLLRTNSYRNKESQELAKKKKVKSDQMILKGRVIPWNAQICESKKKFLFLFFILIRPGLLEP